jgi:Tfp pilus assembly protein PilF
MFNHQTAIDYLTRGDWQAAHEIVQNLEDPLAYWLHALVHRLEGDLDNARYWYRRAKKSLDPALSVPDELDRVTAQIKDRDS